jgi:hypothetical protein
MQMGTVKGPSGNGEPGEGVSLVLFGDKPDGQKKNNRH